MEKNRDVCNVSRLSTMKKEVDIFSKPVGPCLEVLNAGFRLDGSATIGAILNAVHRIRIILYYIKQQGGQLGINSPNYSNS